MKDNETSRSQVRHVNKVVSRCIFFHTVQTVNNTLPYGAKTSSVQQSIFFLSPFISTHVAAWDHMFKLLKSHLKNRFCCIYPVQLVDGNACIFMSPICQLRPFFFHWRQHAGRNKSVDDMEEGGFLSHAKLS